MAAGIRRHDEPKAPLVVPIGSDELIPGCVLRREHDRPARPEHDMPLVHQFLERIAKGVIRLLAVDV